MLPLGSKAPDFSLPNIDGKIVSLSDLSGHKALLVVFICNHCPYVKHVRPELVALERDYRPRGVAMVAINSNDPGTYPADSPEMMVREAREAGYVFPYLFDATQEVAKSYRAACTPDLYLFDADLKLVYRGQIDDTRPNSGRAPNGESIRAALDALLDGRPIPEPQKPSMGCNIKWRPGNEPSY
jgi:peroxiredoxin